MIAYDETEAAHIRRLEDALRAFVALTDEDTVDNETDRIHATAEWPNALKAAYCRAVEVLGVPVERRAE